MNVKIGIVRETKISLKVKKEMRKGRIKNIMKWDMGKEKHPRGDYKWGGGESNEEMMNI